MRLSLYFFLFVICCLLVFSCNNCRDGCENGFCQKSDCNCNDWWEGDACERTVLAAYSGEYSGEIDCDGNSSSITFNASVTDTNPAVITTDIGLTFLFRDQTRFDVFADSATDDSKVGEGEILLNLLSLKLLVSDSLSSQNCLLQASLTE